MRFYDFFMISAQRAIKKLTLSLFLSVLSAAVFAAPALPTDAGRALKENQPAPPPKTPPPPTIKAPESPKPAAPENTAQDIRVQVNAFTFSGNTKISNEQLQTAVAQWTGKALNFGELTQVLDAVEALYHQAGYFLAQATLPQQQIHDGVINIVITEGTLRKVRIEGESRISPDTIYKFLDHLPKGEVVTEQALDRPTLLINELAGGTASMDLQAGDEPGTTDAVLTQKADPLFSGRISLDNQGMPATGSDRLSLSINLNSPLHLGDKFTGNLVGSSGNLHTYVLNYDLPVGGDGWHVHANASRAIYALGSTFKALDASGTANLWRLGASYPYIRSRTTNVVLQLEGDFSNLEDNLGAAGLRLTKKSYGLTFSPSADWQDKLLGGGSNHADMQLRYANLDLGVTAKGLDVGPAGPGTDGRFGKAILSLQRSQPLPYKLGISAQWKQQLATNNLDSSEKLSVGGAQSMVAYPNSQATADEGGVGKVELRWQARDNISLGVFAEYAHLKLLHSAIAGVTTNHAHYSDAGFDLNWSVINHVDFSASVAWAGSQPPIPTDNDRPRIWVDLGYNW